jgi:hypothetical protein
VSNYVDGHWREPGGEDGQDIINPATGGVISHVGFSSKTDIDEHVRAGQEAFDT